MYLSRQKDHLGALLNIQPTGKLFLHHCPTGLSQLCPVSLLERSVRVSILRLYGAHASKHHHMCQVVNAKQ